MKGDEIFNETVTPRKRVTKVNECESGGVKFFSKSESRGIKIAGVTQFASPTLSIYFNFLRTVALR